MLTTHTHLPNSQKLTKPERIHTQRQIAALLKTGHQFFQFPFKILFLEKDLSHPLVNQLLVIVPKKKFNLAVHRNRIKRLVKEAYRKNKYILNTNTHNKQYEIAFMYMHNAEIPFKDIEGRMVKILTTIIHKNIPK